MARRRLSDAEKDARRRADRERLEHAARELLTGDGWKRWIRLRATNGLARYSLRNEWLIALECHRREITPTYIAGFRAFLQLNRCVRKGERAIRILAPVAVKDRDEHGEETGTRRIVFRTVPLFDTLSRDRSCGVSREAAARLRRWTAATRSRAAARVRGPEDDDPCRPATARSSAGALIDRRRVGMAASEVGFLLGRVGRHRPAWGRPDIEEWATRDRCSAGLKEPRCGGIRTGRRRGDRIASRPGFGRL